MTRSLHNAPSQETRAILGDRPDFRDWLGFVALAAVVLLGVLLYCGVDITSRVRPPDSTWALYATFIGALVILVGGMLAMMRLVTKGWLRRWISRWGCYAQLSLAFYWSFAIGLTIGLAVLISDGVLQVPGDSLYFWWLTLLAHDGQKIAFADQPVAFSFVVLVFISGAISLFLIGSKKYGERRGSNRSRGIVSLSPTPRPRHPAHPQRHY